MLETISGRTFVLPHIDANKPLHEQLSKSLNLKPEDIQYIVDTSEIISSNRIPEFGKSKKVVETLVDNMNRIFFESNDLPPTQKKILSGSTSNIDSVSYLKNNQETQKKIDRALDDAVVEGIRLGKSRDQVIQEIEDIIYPKNEQKILQNINTKAQVVGLVLRMFNHYGGRVQVVDLDEEAGSGKKLGEWIGKIFGFEVTKVGGAASQVTDLLDQLGERNATLHSQFNSPDQVNIFRNNPKFLTVTGDEITIKEKKDAANTDDPTKINQIIERAADISVIFNGKKITATNKFDRYIFLSRYYDKDGNIIKTEPTLQFSDEILKKIGKDGEKFEYFFTTSPSYLQRYKGDEYKVLSNKLSEQLKILKDNGVKILYEFSGNTADIRFLTDVLKGNISSFSLNDSELKQLIVAIKKNGFDIKVEQGDDPLTVCNSALALANYLEVDRLHIHGHDLDFTVRKDASEEALKMEVKALMYAKQRVTEWIQGKASLPITPEKDKPSRFLKRTAFIDFLKFSDDLARQIYPDEDVGVLISTSTVETRRAQLMYNFIKNAYYKVDHGYSIVVIPNKWIYPVYDEENKTSKSTVTTSSGDIVSILAALHSGI